MTMLLELKRWVIPPGHQVLLQDVTWTELEQILRELGEKRASRISYSNGLLEIMIPSPEHEDDKVIIGDFVKILLEERGQEFRNLGSTTFKREQMGQAVEPDECFYIQHEAMIRGKSRLNLEIDPPPDLAIEIDITNRTKFNHYEQLGVLELWRFDGRLLSIYCLENGKYSLSDQSRQFPGLDLLAAIPRFLTVSKEQGRSRRDPLRGAPAMRDFREWVKAGLNPTLVGN